MSDIDELQSRITAAMDRIAHSMDKLDKAAQTEPAVDGAGDHDKTARLLKEERAANSELTDRISALKEKSEGEMSQLRQQTQEAQERIAQLDLELQRVRQANDQLMKLSQELRDARGEGGAELVSQAVQTELDSMRATRAADVAEANAIISALTPLVNETVTGDDA